MSAFAKTFRKVKVLGVKFAVVGSGAMGLLVGGKLAKAGNDVTMIDVVPAVIEKLQKDGIHLELPGSDDFIPVKACCAEEMTEPVDVVILFTKTIYSKSALDNCHHYVGPNTWILTMQNGLGNIELIRNYIPEERIIAAVTTYSGDLKGPGHTASADVGYLKMMSANNVVTEQLTAINEAFCDAALNSEIVDDVMVAIWEKVAFNAAINATSAICHVPCKGMGVTNEGRELIFKIAEETCRVANGHGVAACYENVKHTLETTLVVHADHFTSMTQDLLAKRKTESAFISGGVAQKAREIGVDAPYNTAMHALLHTIESTYEIQK